VYRSDKSPVSLEGSAWDIGAESQSLRVDLAENCVERERFLFLSGAYNPYIRDMPIPPTKIGMHYLLDPKAALYNREYDPLYDEQKDGVAANRAIPMLVPGLASIPFDPNDHAVASDKTSVWDIVKNFYRGDQEEEEEE
jgi:hypothetical protein